MDWLEKHEVEYDELYFGKPWANYYIDDNAIKFIKGEKIMLGDNNAS